MTMVVEVGKETDGGRLPITRNQGAFHAPEIEKIQFNSIRSLFYQF
jgi:hypothetical protein